MAATTCLFQEGAADQLIKTPDEIREEHIVMRYALVLMVATLYDVVG